jgi:hydrogenase expression/formation protein HypE
MPPEESFQLNCPIPLTDYPRVLLAHGGGGRLTKDLIDKIFLTSFNNEALMNRHDASLVKVGDLWTAFTTDSYVVKPLFFPGGDIGTLAVNGTVNDLAMAGARPLALSAGFILEEGLPMETVSKVADSMRKSALAVGVPIVTGDTKVVDKGKCDGLFVNTSGIGLVESPTPIGPSGIAAGDVIILSGDLGRHGIAVMASREGLEFETTVESDCAPLWEPIHRLIQAGVPLHCLRDLTRGGLSSALNEISSASGFSMEVEEEKILIPGAVEAACEILGLDPLYVANEGRFVAFVPEASASQALSLLRSMPLTKDACLIGKVNNGKPPMVFLKSRMGSNRVLDMLSGEQLPRIC